MSYYPPLKITFHYSPIKQKDINSLSVNALLWGMRHVFFRFETLVKYAENNYDSYHDGVLIPLASIRKNEYSSLGPELFNQLMLKCVIDTSSLHSQSADKVFVLLFNSLISELSPQLLINIFAKLSSEMLFTTEDEWTGNPSAPYVHDIGPREELITKIILFNVKLKKHVVNASTWDELSLLSNETASKK